MAWHAFTHEISDCNKYLLYMKLFQCVRIEPHSSSLKNMENSTSNFVSSSRFAIEKKKKNNGNCKAFYVTRKRNKLLNYVTLGRG